MALVVGSICFLFALAKHVLVWVLVGLLLFLLVVFNCEIIGLPAQNKTNQVLFSVLWDI